MKIIWKDVSRDYTFKEPHKGMFFMLAKMFKYYSQEESKNNTESTLNFITHICRKIDDTEYELVINGKRTKMDPLDPLPIVAIDITINISQNKIFIS